MTTRMNVVYHEMPGAGYGEMGINIKKSLARLGVEDYGHLLQENPSGSVPAHVDKAPVALWMSTPPHMKGHYEGQLNTLFTMWEYTEMPAGFRENLHYADRVFVPSVQNLELFSKFHDDVVYVPLGVDPEEWKFVPRTHPEREFRFVTSGTGPRKNIEMVDRAFRRVFKGMEDAPVRPKLIVRAKNAIHGRNITAINTPLSREDELALYASAHCYVSASRGEGWGLMPCQAICSGLPTILPNAHGHAAFAEYGIPIAAHEVDCGHATWWGDSGQWWEPDFDQMCDAMWAVYSEYEVHRQWAAMMAPACAQLFNWDNTARELVHHLPESEYPDPIKSALWINTQPRLYKIVTNALKVYVVNGVAHRFEAGKEYWEPYDLKCMIARNGGLDPSCIDAEELGEEQAALALQASQESVCPTCGRPNEILVGA